MHFIYSTFIYIHTVFYCLSFMNFICVTSTDHRGPVDLMRRSVDCDRKHSTGRSVRSVILIIWIRHETIYSSYCMS